MESFYVDGGYLYPEYNVMYWFGLYTSAATWPQFKWQDARYGTPNPLYNHTNWGVLQVPRASGNNDAYPEPNRYDSPDELCAGCNGTEVRRGLWGWADARCGLNFTAMCRMSVRGPCRCVQREGGEEARTHRPAPLGAH